MIKIYGMQACRNCVYVHAQLKEGDGFEYCDIAASTANMRAFLKLRDTESVFDEAKAQGRIGIPCFVKEDGTVTLTAEDVGLEDIPEVPAQTMCCGPEGC